MRLGTRAAPIIMIRKLGELMGWSYGTALQAFAQVQTMKQWDALNCSSHNHILLDSRFVAACLRWLAGPDVLLGADDPAHAHCMALVTKKSLGVWETFQPAQAPLGMVVSDKSRRPDEFLREILFSLPEPILQLGVLQQDPDFSTFLPLSMGPQFELLEYIQTPRLPIAGPFDKYWSSRSGNLRHNLARQQKRIREKGSRLELVVHCTLEEMAGAVCEYARLESGGWKGHEGTALTGENAQGRFYRDIMEAFSATKEALIYQLLLDGKVVASDLCLARNGMLIVLKTAYDETISQMSPALLMRQEIIQRLFEAKTIHVVEFYGRVLDWHLKWTDQVRSMYHINCFRNRLVAEVRGVVKRLA
jgi:Acetyltransferase (GNAT) domain